MKILKPKQVAELLNVTVKTLQNWDKDGVLVAYRTPKNRRYYTLDQINNITKSTNSSGDVVIYARVSSRNQKNDLENQIEFLKNYCNSKGYNIERIITDIGSGLNYNRKNWNDLLTNVSLSKIKKIVISHKDRFIRFGFEWFRNYCEQYNCTIEVVNNEKTSPEQELIYDLISIIHVFSSKIYGLRKYKKEIRKELK